MPAPQLNSYPTHTRTSHPGWYSRLTYLHSFPQNFDTWNSAAEDWYDMFDDKFSTSTLSKGNYLWPAGYWKPGVHQRIKGAFQIISDENAEFNMTVGITNGSSTLSAAQNYGNDVHLFESDLIDCLVHFEWNICSGPPNPDVDPGRYNFMTVHGFYHYAHQISNYNAKYRHIPFRTYEESYRCNDVVTWPYMLIKPESHRSITLLNLTIEELGG
jgi:hypothetical protein